MNIKLKGQVRLQVIDTDGKTIKDTGWMKNTITNTGLAAVAGLVGNTGSVSAFTYLELGTGSTAEAASQTALITAITDSGLARASATVSRTTTTQTNDTLRLVYTWTSSGAKTVEEIGIFNAASTGIMLGRKLTGSTSIISGQKLLATYDVIFA